MSTLAELLAGPDYGQVVILDGGMGTTLQAPPFELGLDSNLWSSELLATEQGKQTLVKLHQTWIQAGAQVIGSCTYQSSLPLFLDPSQTSYTPVDLASALATMNAALPLITSQSAISCLSLGPFGAALAPGQEYGGLYPPPFGPHASSPSKPGYPVAAGDAVPLPQVPVTEDSYEDTLTAWHLQRLTHLAQSDAFDKLGMIAFETVPVLREVSAVRRALALFWAGRPGRPTKPAYVSLVFPQAAEGEGVKFPDAEHKDKGLAEQVDALVEALFEERGNSQAAIGGVGVNCTSPVLLGGVVAELSRAVGGRATLLEGNLKPWLVLYPDGGSVYDVVTRTWSNPHGMDERKWANTLAGVVEEALKSGVWDGVVAGGCCKATPGAIRELRTECEARGWGVVELDTAWRDQV